MVTEKNLQGITLGGCPPLNKVLVIAPHPDDEVLGCGGSIAKHAANGDEVYVAIVTKGCEPLFSSESVELVRAECLEADRLLGVKETIFLDFPAAMLETVPRHDLNDRLSNLIQNIRPDIVYLPHRGDMQLDHKMTADACMVALRPKYSHTVKRILAYETLSETGWDIPNTINEFIPAVYCDITKFLDKKIAAMKIYQTQVSAFPGTRSLEAVKALAIHRGTMMGLEAAEAFSMIREVVKL